jgi:GT2 family glycosyltransferase
MPYIDGGCFAVRAELIRRIPIHNDLVWGEGEDVEWSRRLLMSGKITEISVSSFAISQTDKTRLYGRWGHTVLYRFAFNIHTFILKRLFVLVKNLKA